MPKKAHLVRYLCVKNETAGLTSSQRRLPLMPKTSVDKLHEYGKSLTTSPPHIGGR